MAEESFFVKCPNCGEENSVFSIYLRGDQGTYMRCICCNKFFYTSLSTSPYKQSGDSIAYTKENK